MTENLNELFNMVARTSKIRDEIYRLRSDIREFVRHEDYVLPKSCQSHIQYAEEVTLDDAQDGMSETIIELCDAMRLLKESEELKMRNKGEKSV